MKQPNKDYRVNIDMTWSFDFIVKADNTRQAKKIAFEKFHKTKASKPKNFKISVQEEKW